jgi:hypothetical protein
LRGDPEIVPDQQAVLVGLVSPRAPDIAIAIALPIE